MANQNQAKGQRNELRKKRKGYTSRTSSQGQKSASGGRAETDNQGRPKADNPQSGEITGSAGRKM